MARRSVARIGKRSVLPRSIITVGLPEDFPVIGGGEITFGGPGDIGGGGTGGIPQPVCPPDMHFSPFVGTCIFNLGAGPRPDTPFDPTPFAPDAPAGCGPFETPDPITGECRFDIDPGPGQGFPGNGAAGGGGLTRPARVCRNTFVCPRFADGKTGILWMNALTGDVVCLPRRTNGKGFGLIRKNKPRAKAFISAADKKLLNKMSSVQKKAKGFAQDAGFTCKKR